MEDTCVFVYDYFENGSQKSVPNQLFYLTVYLFTQSIIEEKLMNCILKSLRNYVFCWFIQ
jgi:hypothetical protein